MEDDTTQKIRTAVEDAFSASVQDKRYIDVNRIPLICQSIVGIHTDIQSIKDAQRELSQSMKPITDAFTSISMLGRWGMGVIVFISVLVGIALAVTKLTNGE